jgi:hypothetical protein
LVSRRHLSAYAKLFIYSTQKSVIINFEVIQVIQREIYSRT